jgi:ABC-2 type transport system permease protein
LFAGVPTLIGKLDKPQKETHYVIDRIGEFANLQQLTEGTNIQFVLYDNTDASDISELVQQEKTTGYFVISQEMIQEGYVQLHTDEKRPAFFNLEGILSRFIQEKRIQETRLSQEQLNYLTARVAVVPMPLENQTGEGIIEPGIDFTRQSNQFTVSIALAIILFLLIIVSCSMLLQSALQEKRDRMVEVILSSVSSENLMQGKIIGNFLLGLLQLAVWLGVGLPVAWYFFDINIGELLRSSAANLPIIVFFALLGYLLFAALFIGLGATMGDLQSTNNFQGIAMMLPALSVIMVGPVMANPNGVVAQIGTLFPLISPMITILRIGITNVPIWEIALGGLLLVFTTCIISKVAAKLFRVGMLMYGKTADLAEMWKWLRYN